jgi:hypothetical protein
MHGPQSVDENQLKTSSWCSRTSGRLMRRTRKFYVSISIRVATNDATRLHNQFTQRIAVVRPTVKKLISLTRNERRTTTLPYAQGDALLERRRTQTQREFMRPADRPKISHGAAAQFSLVAPSARRMTQINSGIPSLSAAAQPSNGSGAPYAGDN